MLNSIKWECFICGEKNEIKKKIIFNWKGKILLIGKLINLKKKVIKI